MCQAREDSLLLKVVISNSLLALMAQQKETIVAIKCNTHNSCLGFLNAL